MKKIICTGVALALIGLFLVTSCTKNSEDKLKQTGPICDTVGMKYTENVVPILQANCYSCHGTGNTSGSGGILLEGYANLKVYVNNGYFVGEVTHAPGFIGMPYGLPPLSTCDQNTIVDWVNGGAPNN